VNHRVARAGGNPYAQVTIEDFGGEVGDMFLGKTYQNYQSDLVDDSVVALRGRVSRRDEGMGLHAVELIPLSLQTSPGDELLTLTVPEKFATHSVLTALDQALGRHEGDAAVRLRLVKSGVARVFELPRRVTVTVDLIGEVKGLLGAECLSA
jgi:DNA polymerase-3 subunit alpha